MMSCVSYGEVPECHAARIRWPSAGSIKDFQYREKRISLGVSLYVLLLCAISSSMNRSGERMYFVL